MQRLETTQLDGYGDDVILAERIADGTTGTTVYGVFASEEDARSGDADSRVQAILSADLLTEAQRDIAARNAKALAKAR